VRLSWLSAAPERSRIPDGAAFAQLAGKHVSSTQGDRNHRLCEASGEYHQTGRQTEWLKLQRRGENLHSLLEGPSFDREGNLYVVDV
jgi:hypothetical protein